MKGIAIDIILHFHVAKVTIELPQSNAQLDRIEAALSAAATQQGINMATIDEKFQQLTDKQNQILTETGAYIAERDRIDALKDAAAAEKDATIADLRAQLAAGQITIDEFGTKIDAAIAKADDALTAIPDVPPTPAGVVVPA